MQVCFDLHLRLHSKTLIGLLWSCTTRQWSPTMHVFACEVNSILVLPTAKLFWEYDRTVHTVVQITATLSTQLMMTFFFDNPRSQPGSFHLPLNDWWVTTGFPLFLPHASSLGVSPSLFLDSLGWQLILSCASKAAILAFALGCYVAGLVPCYSCSFLTCICCSFALEFQTALGTSYTLLFPLRPKLSA